MKAGKVDSAARIYTEMLLDYPQNAGILFNRSLAYSHLGNPNLAIQDLKQAICYLLPSPLLALLQERESQATHQENLRQHSPHQS